MRTFFLNILVALISFSFQNFSYAEDEELNQISGSAANWGLWENINGSDRLVELNMSNQNINILPDNLGYLAELKELDFSNNFIFEIPNSIAYLTNLDSLKLNQNSLYHLSSGLSELINLKHLNVSENIFDIYPSVIEFASNTFLLIEQISSTE